MNNIWNAMQNLLNSILKRDIYIQSLKLQGPQCPNALALSPQGRQLASGGDDAIRLWNLPAGDPIVSPDYDATILGQVTILRWVLEGSGIRILIGTGLGYVILWKYDATEDRFREVCVKENAQAGAVEGISIDGSKIAVIYRQQMVIGFTMETSGIRQDWMHHFSTTIPRSVAHLQEDILVWGSENGALHRLKGSTGKELDVRIYPERIGYALHRQVHGRVEYALDILGDGYKIYKGSDNREASRFCKIPRKQSFAVCKQALWIEDETLLATGSDHGKVYIFDGESSCVQKLKHSYQTEVVQTLAASKSSTQFLLATTSMEGDGVVRIWAKERKASSIFWKAFRTMAYIFLVFILLRGVARALSDLTYLITIRLYGTVWYLRNIRSGSPAWNRHVRNYLKGRIRWVLTEIGMLGKEVWTWLQMDERIAGPATDTVALRLRGTES